MAGPPHRWPGCSYWEDQVDAATTAQRLNAAAVRERTGLTYVAVRNPDLYADPARIEHWIRRMVTADTVEDLLTVGVQACAAGHALTQLRCVACFPVHSLAVTVTGMVAHLRQALADQGMRHHCTDIRTAPSPAPAPAKTRRWRR